MSRWDFLTLLFGPPDRSATRRRNGKDDEKYDG
jgi:hypothetical protein